jgi:hypothetical protein
MSKPTSLAGAFSIHLEAANEDELVCAARRLGLLSGRWRSSEALPNRAGGVAVLFQLAPAN